MKLYTPAQWSLLSVKVVEDKRVGKAGCPSGAAKYTKTDISSSITLFGILYKPTLLKSFGHKNIITQHTISIHKLL